MTDPALAFIAEVDRGPAEKRPPNWEFVKKMMARRAPARGESAPDFTLPTLDRKGTITRSSFAKGRPLVLNFGSFT